MLDPTYSYQLLFLSVFTVVAILFALAPLALQRLVAPKKPSLTKNAPYECGVESKGEPWMRFHAQYYLCALLFVVFDVEVVFIYPWAVALRELGVYALIEMAIFIGILAIALVYAWRKGVLDW